MDRQAILSALRRKRRYSSYHTWDDKRTVEGMVTKQVVDYLVSNCMVEGPGVIECVERDPPDCVYTPHSGDRYFIEVSEIVHEPSRRHAEQLKPVAAHHWDGGELKTVIQKRILRKSCANSAYREQWLILHTGEPDLRAPESLREQLAGEIDCGSFHRVYLLGYYHPQAGGVPMVQFCPDAPPVFMLIPR